MTKIKLPDNWNELSLKEQKVFRRGLTKEQKSLLNKTMRSYRKAVERIGEMLSSGFEYRKKKSGKTFYTNNPEDVIPKLPKTISEKTIGGFKKITKRYIAEHSRFYDEEKGKYVKGTEQYNKRFNPFNKEKPPEKPPTEPPTEPPEPPTKPPEPPSFPIGEAILRNLLERIDECYSYPEGVYPHPLHDNAREIEQGIETQLELYGYKIYTNYLMQYNDTDLLATTDDAFYYDEIDHGDGTGRKQNIGEAMRVLNEIVWPSPAEAEAMKSEAENLEI